VDTSLINFGKKQDNPQLLKALSLEKIENYRNMVHIYLPPWPSGLAISGRGAVKAWLAIWQGVGSYLTPAGMSSQVSA